MICKQARAWNPELKNVTVNTPIIFSNSGLASYDLVHRTDPWRTWENFTCMCSYLPAPRHATFYSLHHIRPIPLSFRPMTPRKWHSREKQKEKVKNAHFSAKNSSGIPKGGGSEVQPDATDRICHQMYRSRRHPRGSYRGSVFFQGQGRHGLDEAAVGGENSWACHLRMYQLGAIHRVLQAYMCPFLSPTFECRRG